MTTKETKALLEDVIKNLESHIKQCEDKIGCNDDTNKRLTVIIMDCQSRMESHKEALRILQEN